MKQILILSLSDLASDPRVNRQIRLFATKYKVVAAGLADPLVDGVEFVPISQPRMPRILQMLGAVMLKTRQYDRYYWMDRRVQRGLALLDGRRFDAIVANDLLTLPLALRLARGAKVIFDAHEYAPREFEDRFFWVFFFQHFIGYLCRTYLNRADGMFTVCQRIADEYRARFGVASEVVMNTPPYHELSPGRTGADTVKMIHHGGAIPSRRIELMIETMDHLDGRFQLDLMLVPTDAGYLERLRKMAAQRPRVRMLKTVPMRELPRHLNQYDVGLFLLPPVNFNYRFALPNKLFEFIQARLAVAIGPSPEMARIVRQYDCGIVSGDFTPRSLAASLRELTRERIDRYKERSHAAAKDLCFEKSASILLGTVDKLLASA